MDISLIDSVFREAALQAVGHITFHYRDKLDKFPTRIRITAFCDNDGQTHMTELDSVTPVDTEFLENEYQKIIKKMALQEANNIISGTEE